MQCTIGRHSFLARAPECQDRGWVVLKRSVKRISWLHRIYYSEIAEPLE